LRPKNETLNFQRVGSEPSAMSDHPARPEQEHDVRRATIREKFETTEALRRRDGIIQGVVWRRGRDLREMCYATCIIMVRTDESDELNILEVNYIASLLQSTMPQTRAVRDMQLPNSDLEPQTYCYAYAKASTMGMYILGFDDRIHAEDH
jgi:hypothetical protein